MTDHTPPAKRLPPLKQLRLLFHYNPLTGAITYAQQRGNRKLGQPAGSSWPSGAIRLCIDGKYYRADAVAFALYHERDPYPKYVVPLDGDVRNLRIFNLALSDAPFIPPRIIRRRARRPWYESKKYIRQKDGLWFAHLNRRKEGPFESRAEAIAAIKAMIDDRIEELADA
jgi:hypothetical protein